MAWRYNNLLSNSKNAGEIENKSASNALGRGLAISYKFDNSKPMGSTIVNSISHKLNKDELLSLVKFDNEIKDLKVMGDPKSQPLAILWEQICEEMQKSLSSEDDDKIFRVLLPDFNLFVPQMLEQEAQGLSYFYTNSLIRFLKNLKALVRSCNCTCLISVDSGLLPICSDGSSLIQANLQAISDITLHLTSFLDHPELAFSSTSPYAGTLHLTK